MEHGATQIALDDGEILHVRSDFVAECGLLAQLSEDCEAKEHLQLATSFEAAARAAAYLPHIVWLYSELDPATRLLPLQKKIPANAALLSRLDVQDCVGAANAAAFLGHEPITLLLCGHLGQLATTDHRVAALLRF